MSDTSAQTPADTPAPRPGGSAGGPPDRPPVLITGASRGIGRAVAEELAADHHLILGGRGLPGLEELAATFPSAEPFAVDLTDAEALARAADQLDLPAGLAGLVHSAGTLVRGRIDELEASDWTRSLTANVTAVADLTRALLPALRTARGTVVAINSGSGYSSGPGGGAYAASKFALRAVTDALRAEEREHGVRVSSVHPGRTATDMQRRLRASEGGEYREDDYMRPATVAATIGLALRLPADANIDQLSVRPR